METKGGGSISREIYLRMTVTTIPTDIVPQAIRAFTFRAQIPSSEHSASANLNTWNTVLDKLLQQTVSLRRVSVVSIIVVIRRLVFYGDVAHVPCRFAFIGVKNLRGAANTCAFQDTTLPSVPCKVTFERRISATATDPAVDSRRFVQAAVDQRLHCTCLCCKRDRCRVVCGSHIPTPNEGDYDFAQVHSSLRPIVKCIGHGLGYLEQTEVPFEERRHVVRLVAQHMELAAQLDTGL